MSYSRLSLIRTPRGKDSLFELQRDSNYRKSLEVQISERICRRGTKNCSNYRKIRITEVRISESLLYFNYSDAVYFVNLKVNVKNLLKIFSKFKPNDCKCILYDSLAYSCIDISDFVTKFSEYKNLFDSIFEIWELFNTQQGMEWIWSVIYSSFARSYMSTYRCMLDW